MRIVPPLRRPRGPALGRRGLVWRRVAGLAPVAVLALIVPSSFPSYWLTIATLALIYAILAMSLNLLMGYTGLDSLCQASFFGLGSYGLAILTVKQGVGWWPAAVTAVVLGGLAAAVMGLIAVRLRGLYFLLVTVAMGQVLWGADYRWGTFTGGANGLALDGGRPSEWFYSDANFYYFVLGAFVLVAALVALVIVSPFGLTLKGIRDQEVRSKTLGYVTYHHKYVVFVVAGLLAAVAGVLNAAYNGIASPSDLALDQSFTAMLMVILGGAGTVTGPIVGAIAVTALKYQLSTLWVDYWPIILGSIYVLATVYLPNGAVRGVTALLRPLAVSPTSGEGTAESGSRRGRDRTSPAGSAGSPERGELRPLLAARPHPAGRGPARLALELVGVGKAFDDVRVLTDVGFTVTAGERVGIIGLNGAGKTTLFHVISGIERPSGGRILLFGHDVTRASPSGHAALGLSRTFQVTLLYPSLTVRENIEVALLGSTFRRYRFRLWRPLPTHRDIRARSRELLEAVGLWPHRDIEVRHLSYGHQRQLEIAVALAPDPTVLLLDEPTAGLSQVEIADMRRLLASLPRDQTVIVVEHHLEVIFEFVDRVLVLHQGRIIMDGPPDAVRNDAQVQALYFGGHAAVSPRGQTDPARQE
jgi:ABC-type branched-subunit amino acid transport system ATPase component/ABC-type branched-subunit amino acid transport system permease subunit